MNARNSMYEDWIGVTGRISPAERRPAGSGARRGCHGSHPERVLTALAVPTILAALAIHPRVCTSHRVWRAGNPSKAKLSMAVRPSPERLDALVREYMSRVQQGERL